jgi:sigma-B regulation protein RsbU (phosphoserine phosphatase)
MSAAFLMATTQLLVRMTMQRITDPGRCLTEVNRQLCAQVFNGQFVTMLLMIMDPETGAIEMANAGHPAPLLVKGRGTETLVPLPIDSQLVLGVEPDAAYQTERMDLGAGATLLLYTDGAPDVMSSDGRRFGNDGLKAAVPLRGPDGRLLDARGLVDAVVHAVNRFRGRTELSDDLTLVAIRLTAPTPTHEPEAVASLP